MYLNTQKSILLLEDDIIDVMTIRRALEDLNIRNNLIVKRNGVEGLSFLNQTEDLPGMVLLDLNMPKMNGLEFLKNIKSRNEFMHIPVIILTTSKEQEDRLKSFRLSVAAYMVKPVKYDGFLNMLEVIHHYWELSEYLD